MEQETQVLQPQILYRDEFILIVDKPAGMLSHANQYDRKTPNLVNDLSGKMHQKVFPVHRLDRDTSGIMLFTFDKSSAKNLGKVMKRSSRGDERAPEIRKEYLALCAGTMVEPAEVTVPVRQGGNGEKVEAVSRIHGLKNFSIDEMELCLLSVELVTGRTHQARIHCETIAKPIIGDRQHGWKPMNARFNELSGLEHDTLPPMFLRSWKLSFPHPRDWRRFEVCSGIPENWLSVLGVTADPLPGVTGQMPFLSIDGKE